MCAKQQQFHFTYTQQPFKSEMAIRAAVAVAHAPQHVPRSLCAVRVCFPRFQKGQTAVVGPGQARAAAVVGAVTAECGLQFLPGQHLASLATKSRFTFCTLLPLSPSFRRGAPDMFSETFWGP